MQAMAVVVFFFALLSCRAEMERDGSYLFLYLFLCIWLLTRFRRE